MACPAAFGIGMIVDGTVCEAVGDLCIAAKPAREQAVLVVRVVEDVCVADVPAVVDGDVASTAHDTTQDTASVRTAIDRDVALVQAAGYGDVTCPVGCHTNKTDIALSIG